MQSRGGQWRGPPRPPSTLVRFLPVRGTFSDDPARPTRQPTPDTRAPHAGQSSRSQYVSPEQLFPPLLDPHVPFPSATYQEPLSNAFITSGPVVHEGFIPAPGHEEEDDVYPAYADNPFRDSDMESSDDDDREFERTLAETVGRDDSEKDKDYSTEDDADEDPDDLLLDEELDDEAEPVPKRGDSKTKVSRGRRRGRPTGMGRGGFDGDGPRRKRKPGVRGRPKGKIGPRPAVDPGPEFREIQRKANEAYMRKEYGQAATFALQAIAKNPEIFSAHNLLSEIYSATGQDDASVTALIVGTSTKKDPGLWWLCIDRIDHVDGNRFTKFTDEHKTQLKLNCLKSILRIDPKYYDARIEKLKLEEGLGPGKISACVKQCQKMLALRPHEYDVLEKMAVIGTSTPKATRIHLTRIIESYDFSIAHFVAHEDPASSTLDWNLLNIYFDLLDRAGDYDRALSRLKTLSRWKQGRQDETYWDEQEDDREFDIEDAPRRIAVAEFSRTSDYAKYGSTLPIDIRAKMGIFRLRHSSPNFAEAMHHLEMLEPEDEEPGALLFSLPELFCWAADTLHTTGHDKDALRFYEPVVRHAPDKLLLKSLLGLHTCYTNLGEHDNAEAIIPMLKERGATWDDLAILAKFFEDQGMHREARERAEIVFQNKGAYRLRKVKYGAYEELVQHFKQVRKQARGRHGVRKARVRRYMKKVKIATNAEQDESENEVVPSERLSLVRAATNADQGESESEAAPSERQSLRPLRKRPSKGLFRAKGRLPTAKPHTFLLPAPKTLEGTNVPLDIINQEVLRRKLDQLAAAHADELAKVRVQHRAIVASFERLDQLHDTADNGNEPATLEYLSIARELVQEFSTFDLFYSDRKHDFGGYFGRITSGDIWKESALMALAVEANRIEDGEEIQTLTGKPNEDCQEFYGVHFDKWLDVFGRYALLLARNGEKDRCFSVLDVALQSVIFYRNQEYHHTIELCRLACALAVDDSIQASSAVRWLLKTHPFSTELIRLFSAANRLCSIPEGYSAGPTQKVLLRYIKTTDYMLLTPEQRIWFNFKGDDRTQWMQNVVSSDIVNHVKDHDPALLTLYGNVLTGGGTYVGALNYYFRALAITPEDPALNLSIGIAYIQHAMNRLSENRQFQIQQGLSFINRYHELRTKDNVAVHCSEAEYNVGRIWHGLGLMTQAITAYERCIALSERVRGEAMGNVGDAIGAEDFAAEAAFGIQQICVLSGDFERACRITESALVIE
ncbi:TPR-like protein [Lentithecium fluviatile CBS 122367]|uniref:TPR-like protein n=1 Tax=Lentithecium fluviatile CBS 122367 TaxID=1168545 RepID=A0A6G1J5D4_9PLEO|nr:TPR-like protein [Lentithecium fluviatile CBS 122367]